MRDKCVEKSLYFEYIYFDILYVGKSQLNLRLKVTLFVAVNTCDWKLYRKTSNHSVIQGRRCEGMTAHGPPWFGMSTFFAVLFVPLGAMTILFSESVIAQNEC